MTTRQKTVVAAIAVGAVAVVAWVALARWREARETARRDQLEYAARWELEHGQIEQAIDKLDALAKVDPVRRGLAGLRGRALASSGKPTEAMRELVHAVVEREDAEAWEYTGVAQSQLGALPEAKQALTKAVEIEPGRVSAWRRLGQLCLTSGDPTAAVEAYRQALRHAAGPAGRDEVRLEATTLLEQAGRVDDARLFKEAP
ncbi:MAG: tetratricopeptide repeat protein [Myxococcaceae bacterium]|nr:tetratricopeptide repeat protein [Myxococcaceae bacterium]